MEDFKKKYIEEAFEHVEVLEDSLLKLENDYSDLALIEQVFRSMHTIKGGGAMFGFEKISEFTHHLETIYDKVRNNEFELNSEIVTITLQAVDHIKQLLGGSAESESVIQNHKLLMTEIQKINSSDNESVAKKVRVKSIDKKNSEGDWQTYYIYFKPHPGFFNKGNNPLYLLEDLSNIGNAKVLAYAPNIPEIKDYKYDVSFLEWEIILSTKEDENTIADVFIFVEDDCNIKISLLNEGNVVSSKKVISDIDKLYNGKDIIGEKALVKLLGEFNQLLKSEKKLKTKKASDVAENQQLTSIRVSVEKLDDLMNIVSELVTTQARLGLFSEKKTDPDLVTITENIQKLTRELRDVSFSIVLVPIDTIITRFQRLVRDLSADLGKKVVLESSGLETELDKKIIENLTDPLMHIFRNSLDHGIETPEERIKKGKNEVGTITFNAIHLGASVIIKISDDGKGFSKDVIRNKAIEKKLISPEQVLTDKEILNLVFLPGFSTAEKVTGVSGRGVGMDVVRKKVAEIRGEVEIDSELGVGSTITIKLPLTLSIIDGLLVNVNEVFYVIPLMIIHKIVAVQESQIKDGFSNVVALDGEQISVFSLREEFNLVSNSQSINEMVIVNYDDQKVGIVVDSVVGELQAVIKPLGKHYKNQEFVSGATILGDGTVALVLDTNNAIRNFVKNQRVKN